MNARSTTRISATAQRWNWAEHREKPAFIALQDGTILRGWSAGAARNIVGEVVFNTGMSGYQEILSDPSYKGQIVTMTSVEIGNVGINDEDMESGRFHAEGFLMHEMCRDSNWRAKSSLSKALVEQDVPSIAGIDTRALTYKLRLGGTMKACMVTTTEHGRSVTEDEALARAREWPGLDGQDYAAKVTCAEAFKWDPDDKLTKSWGIADTLPPADMNIVAYDFGIKWNILRGLRRSGMAITVVPAGTAPEKVLAMKPDGVFLSNGPADPAAVTYAIENTRKLLGKVPIMGICLGHQILGLACGGRTYRLKFGHHGCNHPVKDIATGKVEITSQNHNFAVNADSIDPQKAEITHINLNDMTVEGIRLRKEPAFSVQYHPESAPGPHDPFYLFARFREMISHS